MKNMIQKIKETEGYVSIETIVVAGLVIGVGVVAYMAFQGKANDISDNAMNQIDTALNSAVVNPK